MTDIELIDALFAYDSGATDSGIKDDAAITGVLGRELLWMSGVAARGVFKRKALTGKVNENAN